MRSGCRWKRVTSSPPLESVASRRLLVFEGRALSYSINNMDEKMKGFGGQLLLLETGWKLEFLVPPNGEASTLEVEFVKIDYSACTRYHAYFIDNRGRLRIRF